MVSLGSLSRCPSVAESGDGGIGTSCSDSTEGDGHCWVTETWRAQLAIVSAAVSNPDVWSVTK